MDMNKVKDKTIFSLLTSVGLANIGEWIYFIALNIMILNTGGNAWSVGLLYIIRPVADIITNIMFSANIDRFPKKKWMVILTLFRAVLVGVLVLEQQLMFIYAIVFFIQICSSIYEPLSVGYITLAVPINKRKKFNSLNSLVSSGGFLIGPGIAGFLLSIGSPLIAIVVNSLALLGSAIILCFLPNYNLANGTRNKISFVTENKIALNYLKEYYKNNQIVVLFYLLISSLFILAAGLDSVEAAFSKSVLLMSDGQYGLLVSISGAGFVIGSILNSLIVEKLSVKQLIYFGGFTYIIGYLIFSTAFTFLVASIGFFFISFALAYINTGFKTFVQTVFPTDKIGQLTTAFNILVSIMEMFVVAMVSGVGSFVPLRSVLIMTEMVMVLIFLFIVVSSRKLDNGLFEENNQPYTLLDEE